MNHYTYLLLLLGTLSYPLLRSFEPRVQFYKNFKFLFPAILYSAVIFIAADVWFVRQGIWWFNPEHITGIILFNLPLEECLFFFIVPFSSVFIYDVLNYFVKKDVLKNYTKIITIVFCLILLATAIVYQHRFYTLFYCLALAIYLLFHQFVLKSTYMGRFYLLWTILIIPFLLFDGLATWIPIVYYNDNFITGFHVFTTPIEDLIYGILQILLVIGAYEWMKRRGKEI